MTLNIRDDQSGGGIPIQIERIETKGAACALVTGEGKLITDVRSALDLMVNVQAESDCNCVAIYRESLADEFFKLATGLAGEVLQKMVNYQFKLAVIGDYSGFVSKPLQDMIRECNRGRDVFFVPIREEAIRRLASA